MTLEASYTSGPGQEYLRPLLVRLCREIDWITYREAAPNNEGGQEAPDNQGSQKDRHENPFGLVAPHSTQKLGTVGLLPCLGSGNHLQG